MYLIKFVVIKLTSCTVYNLVIFTAQVTFSIDLAVNRLTRPNIVCVYFLLFLLVVYKITVRASLG